VCPSVYQEPTPSVIAPVSMFNGKGDNTVMTSTGQLLPREPQRSSGFIDTAWLTAKEANQATVLIRASLPAAPQMSHCHDFAVIDVCDQFLAVVIQQLRRLAPGHANPELFGLNRVAEW
jgi:hypothetical protein